MSSGWGKKEGGTRAKREHTQGSREKDQGISRANSLASKKFRESLL